MNSAAHKEGINYIYSLLAMLFLHYLSMRVVYLLCEDGISPQAVFQEEPLFQRERVDFYLELKIDAWDLFSFRFAWYVESETFCWIAMEIHMF